MGAGKCGRHPRYLCVWHRGASEATDIEGTLSAGSIRSKIKIKGEREFLRKTRGKTKLSASSQCSLPCSEESHNCSKIRAK